MSVIILPYYYYHYYSYCCCCCCCCCCFTIIAIIMTACDCWPSVPTRTAPGVAMDGVGAGAERLL